MMRVAGPSPDSLLVRSELTLWRQTTNLKPASLVCSTTASAASLIPRNRPSYPFLQHSFEQAGRLRPKRQLAPLLACRQTAFVRRVACAMSVSRTGMCLGLARRALSRYCEQACPTPFSRPCVDCTCGCARPRPQAAARQAAPAGAAARPGRAATKEVREALMALKAESEAATAATSQPAADERVPPAADEVAPSAANESGEPLCPWR